MLINVQSKNEETGVKHLKNNGVRTSKNPLLHKSNENTGRKPISKLTFSELYKLTKGLQWPKEYVCEKTGWISGKKSKLCGVWTCPIIMLFWIRKFGWLFVEQMEAVWSGWLSTNWFKIWLKIYINEKATVSPSINPVLVAKFFTN